MAKRQASLLSILYCISTHRRQRASKEKADYDQDQVSEYSNRQDVRVGDSPVESEHESEHSCHDTSLVMSTLNPQFLGDLSSQK